MTPPRFSPRAGRPTTFSIEIPLQDLQARESPRGNLGGKRILVLANDASNAEILTQQLSLRGMLSQHDEATILPQTSKVLFKSGSRILIADDSSVNQQVVSKMVSKLGLQCDVVGNGLEALRAIESGQYALVLMDCQMPEMDGFEATEAIRTLAGPKAQIPIIAMTANAMKTYGERCLEVGMNQVLTKPVVLDELRTVLGPYFSQKLSRPESRQEQADKRALAGTPRR